MVAAVRALAAMNDTEIRQRESAIKSMLDSHYTFRGTMEQIFAFLGADPGESDLRCRRVPSTVR